MWIARPSKISRALKTVLAKTPPVLIPRLAAFQRITRGALALRFRLSKRNRDVANDDWRLPNVAARVPEMLWFRLLEKALFWSHFSVRYDKARDRRGLVRSKV